MKDRLDSVVCYRFENSVAALRYVAVYLIRKYINGEYETRPTVVILDLWVTILND